MWLAEIDAGAHWIMKLSEALAFRVDVGRSDSLTRHGPGQKGQERGQGAVQTVSDEDLGEFMVDVLLWSKRGHWAFGIRKEKW